MKKSALFVFLFIYNLFVVPLLYMAFRTLGLFNEKVRRGIKGRKNLFHELSNIVSQKFNPKKPTFWFHSSSLGEFEQAKPIIKEIREAINPNIIVTFFSPSGYENSKNYSYADAILYLPFDSFKNAKKFTQIISSPKIYFFLMKYDIWPNHVFFARKKNFTLCLANATVDERKVSSPFKKLFYKTFYNLFDYIFLISDSDMDFIKKLELRNPTLIVTGDTRHDQVYLRSKEAMKKKILPDRALFNDVEKKKIFIAGSSWEEDEEVFIPVLLKIFGRFKNFLAIIVPHEPSEEHIERIKKKLNDKARFILFSELEKYNNEEVIIVNTVGHLMSLYAYADVAYVGGSFKQGIHNVLEPATYGIPIIYGPKIQNSPEAQKLAEIGGGIIIKNKKQLYRSLIKLLSDDELRSALGERSKKFVQSNLGATKKILTSLGLIS